MSPLTITVPGPMRGKGRGRTRRGQVGVYTPQATVNAEAHVRGCAVQQVGQPCLEGALTLAVAVGVMVPASWPKRRRREALEGLKRPTGKPDADNVLKLVSDALNGIVWRDDSQLVEVSVSKRYVERPETVLMVGRVERMTASEVFEERE